MSNITVDDVLNAKTHSVRKELIDTLIKGFSVNTLFYSPEKFKVTETLLTFFLKAFGVKRHGLSDSFKIDDIKYLIELGANVNKLSYSSYSEYPVEALAEYDSTSKAIDVLRLLVKHGAKINEYPADGILNNYILRDANNKLIKEAIKLGAKVVSTSENENPLFASILKKNKEIERYIRLKGGDINNSSKSDRGFIWFILNTARFLIPVEYDKDEIITDSITYVVDNYPNFYPSDKEIDKLVKFFDDRPNPVLKKLLGLL